MSMDPNGDSTSFLFLKELNSLMHRLDWDVNGIFRLFFLDGLMVHLRNPARVRVEPGKLRMQITEAIYIFRQSRYYDSG